MVPVLRRHPNCHRVPCDAMKDKEGRGGQREQEQSLRLSKPRPSATRPLFRGGSPLSSRTIALPSMTQDRSRVQREVRQDAKTVGFGLVDANRGPLAALWRLREVRLCSGANPSPEHGDFTMPNLRKESSAAGDTCGPSSGSLTQPWLRVRLGQAKGRFIFGWYRRRDLGVQVPALACRPRVRLAILSGPLLACEGMGLRYFH
jgi:hypothetical protein